MDRYNSSIAKLFRVLSPSQHPVFGITIGQTTYYSTGQSLVPDQLRRHEDVHKQQWASDRWFVFKYIWQQLTRGYDHNKYELEARRAE